jgi:hypothetical protein
LSTVFHTKWKILTREGERAESVIIIPGEAKCGSQCTGKRRAERLRQGYMFGCELESERVEVDPITQMKAQEATNNSNDHKL